MRPQLTRSPTIDIFGAFVRQLEGWIAIADLVSLLREVDVEENAARSAVLRLTEKGLLEGESRDGRAGYKLTERGVRILEEGDRRMFIRMEPPSVEDGWVLVAFSLPQNRSSDRHRLRSRLAWLGFGSLNGGLWIAPHRTKERAKGLVRDLELEPHVDMFTAHHDEFDGEAALIDRCWDLDGLRESYVAIVEVLSRVRSEWEGIDPMSNSRKAFADYVRVLYQWRQLAFSDPGLPRELLPPAWEGFVAVELYGSLRLDLGAAAKDYVLSVTGTLPSKAHTITS